MSTIATTSAAAPVEDETAPRGALPDFLIIGAAKAGTSTLFEYVRRHPQVCVSSLCDETEPSFFSEDDLFEKGVDWYRRTFSRRRPGQVCGEKSTSYARWPQRPCAARRIAETVPDVKLIYAMRHPVDRAYSQYVHRVARELYPDEPPPFTFEQFIERETMCLDSSLYMKQIEQYLVYYPKEAFLFVLFDHLVADGADTIARMFRFLGIDPDAGLAAAQDMHCNDSRRRERQRVRWQTMNPVRRLVPGGRRLRRFTPRWLRDAAFQLVAMTPYGRNVRNRFTPAPMQARTRRRLTEQFRHENERLAEFLKCDLSHWNR